MPNEAVKTPPFTVGQREVEALRLESHRDMFEQNISEAVADLKAWRIEVEVIEFELKRIWALDLPG